MSAKITARFIALRVLSSVIIHHHSLADTLEPALEKLKDLRDRSLAQALCYGVMRYLFQLQALLKQLLEKPLKAKDADVEIILLLGLFQLLHLRIPTHAATAETVSLTRLCKKEHFSGLVNAILRRFLREQETLLAGLELDDSARFSHPEWFIARLKQHWGDERAAEILNANNQFPPMTLRVNQRKISRADYLQLLQSINIEAVLTPYTETGLTLAQAVEVEKLPFFAEGYVSVQDGAAQLAAQLLNIPEGARVLDACAAPGGKTAHLLEKYQPRELVALDQDEQRVKKIVGTLQRLGFYATICCADANHLDSWWDGQPFDRILLDVPCSATGVIRRHPDIKYLRQASDISALVNRQAAILASAWQVLAVGGKLLYATCSVLAEENTLQLQQFLVNHADAQVESIHADWGYAQAVGRQILPSVQGFDGFYYAILVKTA